MASERRYPIYRAGRIPAALPERLGDCATLAEAIAECKRYGRCEVAAFVINEHGNTVYRNRAIRVYGGGGLQSNAAPEKTEEV
jgi:putative heme iron utilization protein